MTAARRIVATLCLASLLSAVLLGGATGAERKRCGKVTPYRSGEPEFVKTMKVTSAATEEDPVEVTFQQPPSIAWDGTGLPSYVYVGLKTMPKKGPARLNVRAEWPTPSVSDIDMYLRDANGNEVAHSAAWNQPGMEPVNELFGQQGGHGFELITNVVVARCEVFTVEFEGYWTTGETVTLKGWYN